MTMQTIAFETNLLPARAEGGARRRAATGSRSGYSRTMLPARTCASGSCGRWNWLIPQLAQSVPDPYINTLTLVDTCTHACPHAQREGERERGREGGRK